MISFKDVFATVWSIEPQANFVKGRISTSEKDYKNPGKYLNSNWFVTFVGQAKEKALNLQIKDKVKITSGKLSNVMIGEGANKKSYLNLTIFDFEMNEPQAQSNFFANVDLFDGSGDELPF